MSSHFSDHSRYSLTLEQVRDLNKEIKTSYKDWVSNAPHGWFKDSFFREHYPIAIPCLYGQDQPICTPGNEQLEERNWEKERDYLKMRYVNMAIATHVS